jgi:predicted nucleic acid-binding protein
MPADKRSFSEDITSLLYLDASFVIADLFEGARYHSACRAFADRLKAEGAVAVISDFVLDELAFWVVKQALLKEASESGQSWLQVKKSRPDLVTSAHSQASVARQEIERHTIKLLLPDSATDRAFQLMHDHALLPTDAYHVAAALENEVPACVTLDEDFLAVDGLIVYTCLP